MPKPKRCTPHRIRRERREPADRTFLVALLLTTEDQTVDHSDVEDTLAALLEDFQNEWPVLSVTAREVRPPKP